LSNWNSEFFPKLLSGSQSVRAITAFGDLQFKGDLNFLVSADKRPVRQAPDGAAEQFVWLTAPPEIPEMGQLGSEFPRLPRKSHTGLANLSLPASDCAHYARPKLAYARRGGLALLREVSALGRGWRFSKE
jgi:hypothetical protein